MHTSTWLRVVGALAALISVLAAIVGTAAVEPEPGPLAEAWARTDLPVQSGEINRTWIWAPDAFTEVINEDYAESPGGTRSVQYFDKARMEITFPDADVESPWYVTNGLLVLEMVEGYVQIGDLLSTPSVPSTLQIAGDLDGSETPTYADVAEMMALAPGDEAAPVTRRFVGNLPLVDDLSLNAYMVTEGPSAVEFGRDHRTASVFWDFMTSRGIVWNGDDFEEDQLFQNPYYATGLPIAPAFWSTVSVNSTSRDVLIQCFERRCLTYTPDNSPGWQVEAGNVGLHYYTWRYSSEEDPSESPPPAATPTSSATAGELNPSSTATASLTPSSTPTATSTVPPTQTLPTPTPSSTATEFAPPTPTSTATTAPTLQPTSTVPSGGSSAAACLNSAESAFLDLINQYRADNGLGTLTASRSLSIASHNHSLDMSDNNYFSHTSQNGDSPWDRMAAAGYDYNTPKGENIARGYPSAQAVFDGWRKSSGHNANMLNSSFNAIGIGYVSDGHFWTTDFGGYVDAPPTC